jgi:hypothetical protein
MTVHTVLSFNSNGINFLQKIKIIEDALLPAPSKKAYTKEFASR